LYSAAGGEAVVLLGEGLARGDRLRQGGPAAAELDFRLAEGEALGEALGKALEEAELGSGDLCGKDLDL